MSTMGWMMMKTTLGMNSWIMQSRMVRTGLFASCCTTIQPHFANFGPVTKKPTHPLHKVLGPIRRKYDGDKTNPTC